MSTEHPWVDVDSPDALHAWLAEHHATASGARLRRWKKGRGPYVAHGELVPVLLCFGWIDTTAVPIDEDRSGLTVTPRRAGSGWSRVNKQHVQRLLAERRMLPAGQAVIDRAQADGSWTLLDDVEDLVEPPELRAALDAEPAARATWDAFPPSARKLHLTWIVTAKRPATRAERVARTVAEAAAGRRART